MSLWLGLLIITGIGGGFMLLFELSKKNEGIRTNTPCIILAALTVAMLSPAGNLIINILTYTAIYVFVYVAINAYKRTVESAVKETKNNDL